MLILNRLFKLGSVLLVAIALWFNLGLSADRALADMVRSLTPEAAAYEVKDTAIDRPDQISQKVHEKIQEHQKTGLDKGQNVLDTVREKLNLDEPLPESTKEFLSDVKEDVDEVVAPVTGGKAGYYQVKPQ